MSAPVVLQAAALLLSYPDEELVAHLPVIEAALEGTGAEPHFAPVLDHLRSTPLDEAQGFHVREFDHSRRHALHLTYWDCGDTRRRGEALHAIKQTYRASDLVCSPKGELVDYLPMMCEFAAKAPEHGHALLRRHADALVGLRDRLARDGLPHAGVVDAVRTVVGAQTPSPSAAEETRNNS